MATSRRGSLGSLRRGRSVPKSARNVVGGVGGGATGIKLTEQRVKLAPTSAEAWALYGHWTEAMLDTHIASLIAGMDGLHHHIPDSRKMGEAGLPDHLCVLPGKGTIFLEAKRFYRGKPTMPTVDTLVSGHVRKGQETWFRKLYQAATPIYLVYPTDVPDLYSVLTKGDGYTRTALWMRMGVWFRGGVWHLPCSPHLKPRKPAQTT